MVINWKSKLTSRKFWMAVVGLVTGLVIAFGGTEQTAETISGVIMSAASVVAYIIGEGLADHGAGDVIVTIPKDEEQEN